MLNITNRISLSKKSKKKIKSFWSKKGGKLNADSWSEVSNSVKAEISQKLLYNQKIQCVYCEQILLSVGHEIDHFAHKAMYPRFSFNPVNLFYACKDCNSRGRKGTKPTIQLENKHYNKCTFRIIHPYYDNPDNEIKYKDVDKIDFDWDACSKLGQDTITFFEFNDGLKTIWRSKILVLQRDLGFTTSELISLIFELKAYS